MKQEIKKIDTIYEIFSNGYIFCKICMYHISDINSKTYKEYDNKGVIFIAIDYSNYSILEFLLKRGANPNIRINNDWDNMTPIMRAILTSHPNKKYKIIKLLLEYGAYKTLKDNEGNTALDYAKKYGCSDKIIKLLS